MAKFTIQQIAADYRLWVEYFDTDGNMTEDEFDSMTIEARVELLNQAFGL